MIINQVRNCIKGGVCLPAEELGLIVLTTSVHFVEAALLAGILAHCFYLFYLFPFEISSFSVKIVAKLFCATYLF